MRSFLELLSVPQENSYTMRVPMLHTGYRRDRNWRKPICLPPGKNQFWTNLYAIWTSLQQVRKRLQQLDEQKAVWTLAVHIWAKIHNCFLQKISAQIISDLLHMNMNQFSQVTALSVGRCHFKRHLLQPELVKNSVYERSHNKQKTLQIMWFSQWCRWEYNSSRIWHCIVE